MHLKNLFETKEVMGKRNAQILKKLKDGAQVSQVAQEFEVVAERIRQIKKIAEKSKKLSEIPDEDLILYTLGEKTRNAINMAAGKPIATIQEFKDWVATYVSDKPKTYQLGEKLAKLDVFSDPSRRTILHAVLGFCEELGLTKKPFEE